MNLSPDSKTMDLLNLAYSRKSIRQRGMLLASPESGLRNNSEKWDTLADYLTVAHGVNGGGLVDKKTKESLSESLRDFFCYVVDKGLSGGV